MDEGLTFVSIVYFLIIFIYGRKPVTAKKLGKYHAKDVTVVIPVYREDESTFLETVKSVAKQGVKFIVVGDGCSFPYKEITKSLGGEFIEIPHSGKKVAVSRGVREVKTPLIMLLDSDTVIEENGIEELASRFDDETGGITPNVEVMHSPNSIVYFSSRVMDFFRKINARVLQKNGGLMVLNGQCSMYRTDAVSQFINSEEFLKPKEGFYGDDREITMFLKSRGLKVKMEESVRALTAPPSNLKDLINQMTRWFKAGYYYYVKEIEERTTRNPVYFYVLTYWYLLPVLVLAENSILTMDFSLHFLRILDHVMERQQFGIPLLNDVFAFRRAMLIALLHGIRLMRNVDLFQFNTTIKTVYSLMEVSMLLSMSYSMKIKSKEVIYSLVAFPLMFITSMLAMFSLIGKESFKQLKTLFI
ncbi:hypothetical protein IC006_0363 [Sulfuracidifex tepidarius]|uniref:Glycosyltransferase 2-like domain-containing protein n=2 Tax=Sulfuracidifex tepidarius TaxID=1294262 RepID=A0A510DSC1_9CREN|nr:glycosyltransferase [Sulfuracidifex tepidarius]BBG23079.1 hypothetical protein IC006_0363 [Sulfuracidifex tepidarius]BBG25827.1 hypothetical protein IC007_0332 [Sulfuracidifex tepidarius]